MKTLHISIFTIMFLMVATFAIPPVLGISGSALFMKSDSTAKIYADYTFRVLSNETWTLNPEIFTSMADPNSQAKGITIVVSPSSFTGNTNHTKVVFTITAKGDSKGVYSLFLFFCGSSPLVVGLNESEVDPATLKDFFTATYMCPMETASTPDLNIVGYSGMVSKDITINPNNTINVTSTERLEVFDSPLTQYKSGIKAENVKCNDGFQLIFKLEDGSPACVSQQTKEQLLNRGWGVEGFARTEVTMSPKTNELEIDLANQTYEAGYPIDVNLKNVNQDYGCKIPSVTVREESSRSLVFGPTPERDYGHSHCADPWDVTFYAGLENNSLVTKPTRYEIIATHDNMTYQKEFTAIPSNYSGTSISSDLSQVLPGFLTFTSCLPIPNMPPNNGTLISYSGFDLYHRYLAGPETGGMEFDDYLLKPGQTGSFVMQVHQGQFLPGHNLAGGLSFLSGNLLNVDNSTVWKLNRPLASEDHPGLDVNYSPIFAVAGPDGYATITVSISARQNAPQGSYWLYLPPGVCGGHRVLLTVGDKPLSQPPDYIGYDFDSNFVVDTGKQLVFELINPGIHTFENCTLGYTSKNQTTIVKTFDVILPGMEYKHIWNASSDQIDKRFLECKSPHITKVYPDMMIDGLPW